jgi:hypothetical protein
MVVARLHRQLRLTLSRHNLPFRVRRLLRLLTPMMALQLSLLLLVRAELPRRFA